MPSGGVFDLATKEKQIEKLNAESGQPGFWDDQQAAQRKMQEISALREMVNQWEEIYRRANDALELSALAEDDPEMLAEL